jgi:TonB family protein
MFERRWLVAAAMVLRAAPAAGQQASGAEPPASSAPAPARVEPPKLLEQTEAEFPQQARDAGLEHGVVLVRATIDAQGHVAAAEVPEAVGYGFDEAALSAVQRYRFEPAYRGEVAVSAIVLIRVELSLPTPEAAGPEAAPPAPESAAVPSVEAPSLPAAPAAPATPPATPVEFTVQGQSAAERLRRSAEAVHVVETETARRQSADLGEVLARSQGVGVQRSGGLGSDTRFSLNGLTDDQIRFFLDGVPLELAGYPFGLANVPVNLVDRAEIYRGVVPVRFGADALGGAVNLVTDDHIDGTHSGGSLQVGSFGTLRATWNARHLQRPSGWLTRVSAFRDHADNDYPMNIEVADARGRNVPARVYRFHDAYSASGASVETGVVDKPWARRLLLRAFASHYDKQIQHNLMMTFSPYGDVTLAGSSAGASLRYENRFARRVGVNLVGGYAYTATTYRDLGQCVYDWFGQCLKQRAQPGERRGRPEDQLYTEHAGFARLNADYRLLPSHTFRLSLAPTFVQRWGDERRQANPDARDALSAERRLLTLVTGVEHQLELLGGKLQNVAFAKDYVQVLRSEEPLSTGAFVRRDRGTQRLGMGNALRYAFADWIYAKASYEWATRLPRPDEVFGNAFPIRPNLELRPELSHNSNLGVTLTWSAERVGTLRSDCNGFWRDASQLIVLVGDDQTATYQNVYSARSLGVEASAGWTSPGDYVSLDGNVTWVDFRNTSRSGAFAANVGERIPNRPYLFSTGSLRLQARSVVAPRDELSLTWVSRYVHAYFRGWEGLGTDKLTVDAQLLHALSLTYLVRNDTRELTFTGEVQNLTDAPAFDVFGVPRPGRAFYFKATASL